ncbi:phage tail protein [Escherichia coli]|uniref:phage tail protein n=1 Tax=Escherichia coli TaxID=562 RepID=UPI0021056D6C|nr:phage tail protein [Escherichia coli]MCQ1905264.1 phage tail protein [Escherichia coli]MCQ1923695.1 phage tail protein [Escherichia coli]
MTAKYFAILTNQGAARLANAATLGTKLNLTQMAVGDANGVLPTPDPAQTKLINQKRIAPLNLLTVDPANTSQIIAEQIIPENEGGFWIREIGLYDDAGVLIAVANCPETYKPELQEGSGRTQTIRMILIVSSTSAITLKIDPSVVLATRQYVDDKVIEVKSYADGLIRAHEQSRNHPDATTTAKGFTQLNSSVTDDRETQSATPKAVKIAMDNANARLAKERNLSDLTNPALARQNLQLGDSSTKNTGTTANTVAAGDDARITGAMQKSQNGADIQDVAKFLQNLGLTNFADKNRSNEQMFNGVVASKKGVSAASSDGNRRVNLFVSETGYELIVYIDGKYNNSIQIPTKYGTMALLDDVSNSVQSAPPPIGIPFLWPLSAMPNTVVPEWASNVFLKMNDATFSASTYPALARVWPGLKLTDCRGEFLRIWDDGRGVDSGRALLSAQGDAMRNFTGNAGFFADGLFTYASGAFKLGPSATNKLTSSAGSGANAYVTLDPSTVVPTAAENRPRNVAFNLLVRAK